MELLTEVSKEIYEEIAKTIAKKFRQITAKPIEKQA